MKNIEIKETIAEYWHVLLCETKTVEMSKSSEDILIKTVNKKMTEELVKIEEKHKGKFILKKDICYIDEYFNFPSFFINFSGTESYQVDIRIYPCIGASPNTKIMVIPNLKGEAISNKVLRFFGEVEEISHRLCLDVTRKYFNILKNCNNNEVKNTFREKAFDEINFHSLSAHIIGEDDKIISKIIDSKKSGDEKNIDGLIKSTPHISRKILDTLNVLTSLTNPSKRAEYQWFTRKTKTEQHDKREGLFAFLETKDSSHFIGITDGSVHKTANNLMMDIMRTI